MIAISVSMNKPRGMFCTMKGSISKSLFRQFKPTADPCDHRHSSVSCLTSASMVACARRPVRREAKDAAMRKGD